MFSDLLDMTLSYVQYISLLLRLSPDIAPAFYTELFNVLRYVILDSSANVNEKQRYHNYLRVNLPDWLPLDIRLRYVCIALIGPMVVTTLGMMFVYGKPAYIWFTCVLGTLFMFLFGFILLANLNNFAVPGAVLPSRSVLSVLGGVGLPCFLLLLAGGLLGMGRARLQRLRKDAAEMDRLVEKEQQRRRDQQVTQQMVDREGIDLVAVAAEQLHAQRVKDTIEHIDCGNVVLQGLFVAVLLMGSLILLGAIKIPAVAGMQTSTVFKAIGGVVVVVWACVTFWWVLDFFKKGRQLQFTISYFVGQRCLSLVVTMCNLLYINVVTNFIAIIYCTTLRCEAGTRTPFSASLFPAMLDVNSTRAGAAAGLAVGCLACDYHVYPQRCSTDWQRRLCTSPVQQRRLVYDPRVQCDDIDVFFKVSGSLIFAVYVVFLPYLQFYMAQYAVQVLKESYPLERRYYDVFTQKEIYFQKVLSSRNTAAFAYCAYKPELRFYRLSFLLQKLILGVVGCVMRKGLSRDVAWAGMVFFLVVPLIALSCALYLKPFSRQVEAYYFVAVQAMVSVCAVVLLAAQRTRRTPMPLAVWVVLLALLIGVPICVLVVGNALTLREERRWTELWQRRLVESVTAAYDDTSQRLNPLCHPSRVQEKTVEECSKRLVECCSPRSGSRSSSSGEESSRVSLSLPKRRAQRRQENEEDEADPVNGTSHGILAEEAPPKAVGRRPLLHSPRHSALRSVRRRRHSHRGNEYEGSLIFATTTTEEEKSKSSTWQFFSGLPAHSPRHTATATAPPPSSALQHHHHKGPEANSGTLVHSKDASQLRADTAATTALVNLRVLRVLPSFLQAETWGDFVKLVLELAGRTVFAPFSHLHQRGVVDDVPFTEMSAQVRSTAGEGIQSGLVDPSSSGAVKDSDHNKKTNDRRRTQTMCSGSGEGKNTTLSSSPQVVGAANPHQPHSTPGGSCTLLSALGSGLMVSPASHAHKASTLSMSLSLSRPSGRRPPVAHPMSTALLNSCRVSTSLSAGHSTLSPALQQLLESTDVNLATPPACVMAPTARELASLPHQQRRSSLPSTSNRDGTSRSPSNREVRMCSPADVHMRAFHAATTTAATSAALTVEDAGEYIEDATETFVPSLYFVEQRICTGRPPTATRVTHSTDGNRLARKRRSPTFISQEVGEVRLPWRRCVGTEQEPLMIRTDLNHPHHQAALSTVNASPPQHLHSTQQKASRSAWIAAWEFISSAGDDAVRKRRRVLRFVNVYVRRQRFKQTLAEKWNIGGLNSNNNGVANDVGALTPAQRRRCARKAFWGCPTDAMLGVVDVPGSMPPWSLYCHAPPPPPPSSSSVSTAAHSQDVREQQPERRSMFSLQRQYYAQLVEEQRRAAARAQDYAGSTWRRGSPVSVVHYAPTSLTISPLRYTSLSHPISFGLPRPIHPLCTAAYERHSAAARAYRREKGDNVLPLDTELDTYANAGDEEEGDAKGEQKDGGGVGLADISLSGGATTAAERQNEKSGTLHWLRQWGPVLTELLYEAAMDDNRRTTSPHATAHLRDSDSEGSDVGRRSPSCCSSPSQSSVSVSSPPRRHRSERGDHYRHDHHKLHALWQRWLPRMPWSTQAKVLKKEKKLSSSKKLAGTVEASSVPNSADFATSSSPPSRKTRSSHKWADANGGSGAPLNDSSQPHSLRRHQSTLLTLITGMHPTHTHTVDDGATASLREASVLDGKGNSSEACSPHSSSMRWRGRPPNEPTKRFVPSVAAPAQSEHSDDVKEQQAPVVAPIAPQDPLIQQLRCLYLVRQRLKESYWEHRKQLTAVQHYIDYEIDETMQRVLTFSFIVVGTVATISFALATVGLMHTLNWKFINGVRHTDYNLRYELAGYTSWKAFTENCCCMAATSIKAEFPFYALDVENWVCANGITKERVRRDGYDGEVVDGYTVRPLCGMEFVNGCGVTVDVTMQTAKLTGCDTTGVTAASMLRW